MEGEGDGEIDREMEGEGDEEIEREMEGEGDGERDGERDEEIERDGGRALAGLRCGRQLQPAKCVLMCAKCVWSPCVFSAPLPAVRDNYFQTSAPRGREDII